VRVTVVPVPPASRAGFATVRRARQSTPDPKRRLDVRFNAASRTWYVLQYDPADPQRDPIAVEVDDETGTVRVFGD
jgi:hypothetical protein